MIQQDTASKSDSPLPLHPPLAIEITWGLLLLAAGLGLRAWLITTFPTQPISDFRSLVDFGVTLRDTTWAQGAWHWRLLNPGLPSLLALLFRLPGSPETIARVATAVLGGLVPMLPFLICRGALSFPARLLGATLLAVWPGAILLSGVAGQDLWVIAPSVALAALAVRAVKLDRSYPVAAGVLLVLGLWIRQEMLVALLPLACVAAAGAHLRPALAKKAVLFAVTTAVLLVAVAGQRSKGTGRFALTSGHFSTSLLGSFLAGSSLNYWVDPGPALEARDPETAKDPAVQHRVALQMVKDELTGRPVFHLARICAAALNSWFGASVGSLYWAFTAEGVQQPERQAQATSLANKAGQSLKLYEALVHVLFVAAVWLALRNRDLAVLSIALAFLLKGGIHALIVAQPRYFLPSVALEMVAVAAAVDLAFRSRSGAVPKVLLASLAAVVLLFQGARGAAVYAASHDEPPPPGVTGR